MPTKTIQPQYKSAIKAAVGPNVDIFAATAAKVYTTSLRSDRWTSQGHEGALVLLKDRQLSGLFFRLVALSNDDCNQGRVIWEHEIPFDFEYRLDTDFFHSFESDSGVQVGFLFCEEREAEDFAQVVYQKSEILQISAGQKASRESFTKSAVGSEKQSGIGSSGGGFLSNLFRRKDKDKSREPIGGDSTEKSDGKSRRASKRNGSITADDIGDPTDFQHLSHIGFNAATGAFDIQNIPDDWRRIFEKAGVTKEQLENADTAGFIAEFVKKNVDRMSVEEASDEAPQAKGLLLPPSREEASGEVPRAKGLRPPPPSKMSARGLALPHPIRPTATPPMKPTGAPPASQPFRPAVAPPSSSDGEEDRTTASRPMATGMPVDPGRAQLLASIRSAGTGVLRPAERSNSVNSMTAPTTPNRTTSETPPSSDIMASMLAKALAARKKKMAHSDSDDDNGSEW